MLAGASEAGASRLARVTLVRVTPVPLTSVLLHCEARKGSSKSCSETASTLREAVGSK
jgi:hypothetical protein